MGVCEILEGMYRKGMVVRALDESGKPLLRNGEQVYKVMDHATSAERAFWNYENNVN